MAQFWYKIDEESAAHGPYTASSLVHRWSTGRLIVFF